MAGLPGKSNGIGRIIPPQGGSATAKRKKKKKVHTFGVQIGQLVLIKGNHPHAGKVGTFDGWQRTIFGTRPVVSFPDGNGCFVMDPKEWGPVR